MAMLGCRNPSSQSSEDEGSIGALVADFDQHLAKVCGLSPATRFYRRRYAREFLKWRFESKRWDLTKLCFADFVDYVKFQAARRRSGRCFVPRGSDDPRIVASHRLRYSFATRLHARGASLKEVADVLGHQHFDTTAIYARVNLAQLRKVALPWPRTRR